MAVVVMKLIGHGPFQLLFSTTTLRNDNIATINAAKNETNAESNWCIKSKYEENPQYAHG